MVEQCIPKQRNLNYSVLIWLRFEVLIALFNCFFPYLFSYEIKIDKNPQKYRERQCFMEFRAFFQQFYHQTVWGSVDSSLNYETNKSSSPILQSYSLIYTQQILNYGNQSCNCSRVTFVQRLLLYTLYGSYATGINGIYITFIIINSCEYARVLIFKIIHLASFVLYRTLSPFTPPLPPLFLWISFSTHLFPCLSHSISPLLRTLCLNGFFFSLNPFLSLSLLPFFCFYLVSSSRPLPHTPPSICVNHY